MNQTSKDLRLAVKEVYESQSVNFSDCYELEGLKPIRVIFLPSDAPRYVSEIAEFLQTKVRLKYPEINPEIITISSLFNKDGDLHEMTCKALSDAAQHLKEQNQAYGSQSVILCSSDIVAEILIKKRFVAKSYEECFIPKLICDVDSFTNYTMSLELAAHKASVSAEILTAYAAYHKKIPCNAEVMVVFASSYECWNTLIDLWHRIEKLYGTRAKIMYIDDIKQWTSKEYSDKIFAKFSWLAQKSKIADLIERMPPYEYTIVGRIAEQTAIFCISQEKSYWVYNIRQATTSSHISFHIERQEFEDIWCHIGPIGRQFFCQDMKNLAEATKKKSRLDNFALNKRFSKWNLRLFWWNYKICIKNYCRISFLSY